MYTFNLSRRSVNATGDKTSIVGYNYYLQGFVDGELKREELIHTSIGSPDPLDLKKHDLAAKDVYSQIIKPNIPDPESGLKFAIST